MTAIVLAVLQIFLLLLRAHFTKNEDSDKALESLKQAQSKLDEIAQSFELSVRYPNIDPNQLDSLQDTLDKDKKDHAPHN